MTLHGVGIQLQKFEELDLKPRTFETTIQSKQEHWGGGHCSQDDNLGYDDGDGKCRNCPKFYFRLSTEIVQVRF